MVFYHLVEFLALPAGREVAVIPDSWLIPGNGRIDKCHWPDQPCQSSWIRRGKEPDPSWPLYAVKLLYSGDDFKHMQKIEKRALERSDINSSEASDADQSQKRKRVSPDRWSPAEDEGPKDHENEEPEPMSDSSDSSGSLQQSPTYPSAENAPGSQFQSPSGSVSRSSTTSNKAYILPRAPSFSPSFSASTSSASRNLTASQHGAAVSTERRVERSFKLLEEFKAEMKELSRKMDRLLLAVTGKEGDLGTRIRAVAELPDGFTFPIGSYEMERLDSKLSQDRETRQRMVRHLGTIGGRDQKDCLRRILAVLVSTFVARQYNYLGMKGKRCFCALRAFTATIHDGLRRLHPQATEAEMRDVIASWLSGSRDRDNGKRDRVEAKRAHDAEREEMFETNDDTRF